MPLERAPKGNNRIELERELIAEQKRAVPGGIEIIYGPRLADEDTGSDKTIYEIMVEGVTGFDNIIIMPDDPEEQAKIIEKLPELAKQANGHPDELFKLLSDFVYE